MSVGMTAMRKFGNVLLPEGCLPGHLLKAVDHAERQVAHASSDKARTKAIEDLNRAKIDLLAFASPMIASKSGPRGHGITGLIALSRR